MVFVSSGFTIVIDHDPSIFMAGSQDAGAALIPASDTHCTHVVRLMSGDSFTAKRLNVNTLLHQLSVVDPGYGGTSCLDKPTCAMGSDLYEAGRLPLNAKEILHCSLLV